MNIPKKEQDILPSIGYGYVLSRAIMLASELKLHKILIKPLTLQEIMDQIQCVEYPLKLLLEILFTHKIIDKKHDQYSPTPAIAMLDYISPAFNGHIAYEVLKEAMHTMKTGEPAWNKVFGKNFYDILDEQPEWSADWHEWNRKTGQAWLDSLLTEYDFEQFTTFVDIGGGEGALTCYLLSKFPNINSIILDRADCKALAEKNLKNHNLEHRCQFVTGSFFNTIPVGGDAYCLSRVLINWDDSDSVKILKTIHQVMTPTTKLLINDFLMPDENEDDYREATLNNFNLYVLMKSRRRTLKEWDNLLQNAGFTISHAIPSIGNGRYNMGLIEAMKAD